MTWLFQSSLACYVLLAIGLASCLHLFISLKREIQVYRKKQKELRAALGEIQIELARLREELAESERRAATLVAPAPTRSGFNLSTRSQALRMSRRGNTNQEIAAALEIPEKEVELLLKVQRIALDLTPPAGNLPAAPETGLDPAPTAWEETGPSPLSGEPQGSAQP
jgi:hypothetical protein